MRTVARALGLSTVLVTSVALAACSAPARNSDTSTTDGVVGTTTLTVPVSATAAPGALTAFVAEVWADNWFALFVNGTLVGQDSVPITTERSFNSETISFTAAYPLTIAMVTKDFVQNDTGLEYIGTDRQQMGDGGFIAQITDTATGKVVARTDGSWRSLVVHRAPLDVSCEKSASPQTDCSSRITPEPDNWASSSFDDSAWTPAVTYTADEVGVKEGYYDISWETSARLIWSSSLKQDNTILWRHTVTSP